MRNRIIWVDKLIFVEKDTIFRNTIFLVKSKVGIICTNCNVYFENCKIVFYRCKMGLYGLFASNSNIEVNNCSFQNAQIAIKTKDSNLSIYKSIISYNKQNAINAINSRVSIESCNIFLNGGEILNAQIWLYNTFCSIKKSSIKQSVNAIGIHAKSSLISLNNVDLFLNQANAIILEHSKFDIKKSKIFDNAILWTDSSALYIEDSQGSFEYCLISKSRFFSFDITKQSKIKILKTFVFDNQKGILVDRNSLVTIYKSRIFRNGIFLKEAQISLDASKVNIVNTKIFNSYKCVTAQKISYIFAKNSKFSSTKEPISLFELSKFTQK